TIGQKGRVGPGDTWAHGGGQVRIATPPDPAAAARGGRRGGPPRFPTPPPGFTPPISAPNRGLVADGWNRAEILLDVNVVRAFLNDSGETAGGIAGDDAGNFG